MASKERPNHRPRAKSYIVSFHIPGALLEAIDRLVEAGIFNNRSEAIRAAIFNLVKEYSRMNGKWAFEGEKVVGYR